MGKRPLSGELSPCRVTERESLPSALSVEKFRQSLPGKHVILANLGPVYRSESFATC